MRLFGLIGYPLAQSFSKKYFTGKFLNENITDAAYELFELTSIQGFEPLLKTHPDLCGINVTIPYKQDIIPLLNSLDEEAKAIAACNCIKISNGILKGYNTDAPAFEASLKPLLQAQHNKALILGTGGASKAVAFVLSKLNIAYKFVSRTKKENGFTYEDLSKEIIEEYLLIINTTPLGSFPAVDNAPAIPYQFITNRHCLYDLIYNPARTLFLQKGAEQGATTKNGYEMLVGQAELSWKIWNDKNI